jgi:hypothetical protein
VHSQNVIPLVTIIYLDKTSKEIELLDSFTVTILVIVNPETQIHYFENKGNKTMSNEQLMQEELKKAMGSVNEVATDELSDEELEVVAGGFGSCIKLSRSRNFTICGPQLDPNIPRTRTAPPPSLPST